LLPIMLPIAIFFRPFMAAVADVASSGSEVPIATIVTAMNSSETFRERAMLVAPKDKEPAAGNYACHANGQQQEPRSNALGFPYLFLWALFE